MSTRRARIKAVTSLPPRRKNNGNESKAKLSSDKNTKSPRTTSEEIKSPRTTSASESRETDSNTNNNIVASPVPSVIVNKRTTPEISPKETASAIPITPEKLSTPGFKNITAIFVSPVKRNSPKKTFASPIAPSPKILKNSDAQKSSNTYKRSTPTAQKISENNELQIAERIVNNIEHNIDKCKDNTKDVHIVATTICIKIAQCIQCDQDICVSSTLEPLLLRIIYPRTMVHADKVADYNIPSVPESPNEAMDGIVPLQPSAAIPKSIDILKSEIISENAEVLFDPIIPLPSPSKVRPKLRPVPRLDRIHRRNSVQGSASESEDESRRGVLNSRDRQTHEVHTLQSIPNRDVSRVRNDSVCSSVSQVTNQPMPPASPVKDRQIPKTKRQEEARRRMALRRRKENTKREGLTMYDLIFYNPTSNPIVPNEDELKIKEANEKNEAEKLSEEKEQLKPKSPEKTPEAAPVPQIKLGPKGEIILDEQSLVIKQTESDRKVASVVHEGAWGSGGSYRKYNFCRSACWTAPETVRFYRALAALGTDFTLMAQLFPNRTRKQLKVKFKKEEKLNGAQIDRALRATVQFDVALLKKEFEEERALAAKQAELDRERFDNQKQAERERLKAAKDVRMRQSRGAKALEAAKVPKHHDAVNTEDIIEHAIKARKRIPKILLNRPIKPLPKIALSANSRISEELATSKSNTPVIQIKTPDILNPMQVPSNIETGSLVVLTVNDPSSPATKMLQTYIASGPGKLTPVALPPTFLNCVVGYMKKGTPKGSTVSSPQLLSPSSVTSHDSHSSATAGSILPTPAKRQRHSSYTITQL